MAEIETESEALKGLLDSLAGQAKAEEPADAATAAIPDRFAVLIECPTEERQLELLERFAKEGIECRALIV